VIDYVTCSIPVDFPRPIYGGRVISTVIGEDDETQEYCVLKRLGVEGSHSSCVHVRCIDGCNFELKGNLVKWLQGHNLYGSDCLFDILRRSVDAIFHRAFPDLPVPTDDQLLSASLSRVDITEMFQLADAGEVALWLRTAAQTAVISHRGRGSITSDGNTLTWGCARGKRASSWALIVYNKGAEIAKHPLPAVMMADEEVINWVSKCLRFELRMTGSELKRLNVRYVRQWVSGMARAMWTAKTGRLFFQDTAMEVQEMIGVKARVRDAYYAWLNGIDPRAGRSLSTFKRLRSEVKQAYNVDIAVDRPQSGLSTVNIMPCRRTLSLKPVSFPSWANRIEAKLAA